MAKRGHLEKIEKILPDPRVSYESKVNLPAVAGQLVEALNHVGFCIAMQMATLLDGRRKGFLAQNALGAQE